MKVAYAILTLGLMFTTTWPNAVAASDDHTVKLVAGSPGYAHIEPFMAEYLGLWKKYGVKVDFEGGNYRRDNQLMAIGDFDAGYTQYANVIRYYAAGLPDVIVGSSAANCAMIVTNPKIKSWADLKGKRIGVDAKFDVQWLTLVHEILPRFGLSQKDVEIALVQVPETAAAVLTGGMAAAFPFAPYGEDAVGKGARVLLPADQMIDKSKLNTDMLRNGIAMNIKFIKEHHDLARKIMWAHLDAVHEMRTNPELGVKVIEHYNPNMDPKLIKAAYKNCGWQYKRPPKIWIDTLIKWMKEDQLLKKNVTYDQVTDFSLQKGYKYPGWETIKTLEKQK